jgi:CubicO group peptidase (beta-lactamase class C family)
MIERTQGEEEMIQKISAVAVLAAGFAYVSVSGAISSEDRAVNFVEAFNSGNEVLFLEFQNGNYSPSLLEKLGESGRGESYRELFRKLGGQKIVGVDLLNESSVVLTTQSQSRQMVRFRFSFEKQLISGVDIHIGEASLFDPDFPRPVAGESLNNEDLRRVLSQYFDDLEKQDLFSGAILVQTKGQTLFEGAYGLASRRFGVPNRLDTRFDVGSITKEFTVVAIAQLMMRGKLSLEDKIGRYLPDYKNPEVANRVTIEQLVSHTSGLGDVFTPEYFKASKLSFRSVQDYLDIFADDPLCFEPGQGKAYSNYGFIVLGAIVEAVSGQRYSDYIRTNIFTPAGMKGSGFFASDEPEPNVAIGYTRLAAGGGPSDRIRNNILQMPVNGAPDGGSHSTVADLAAFDSALREHRLLSPRYSRWVFGGPNPEHQEVDTENRSDPIDGALGIAGGAPGISAVLLSDAERRIIVLANMDEPIAEQIAEILDHILDR